MDFQASARSPRFNQQSQTLIILSALMAASLSLTYAALTTRGKGVDLLPLHDMTRAWVQGNYDETLRLNIYPPATIVFLSPISMLSFGALTIVWFILNLLFTGLSSYLAIKLLATNWPWRANYFLILFVMSWAPFRVTLRNGQITMLIVALLLGSLLAWRRQHIVLSGVLLGLALCKYTLTVPFLFYFIWQQQWKLIISAISLQAALTGLFAYRLGVNFLEIVLNYFVFVTKFSLSFPPAADLNSLLLGLTGGNRLGTVLLGLLAVLFSLALMFLLFKKRPEQQNSHFALLSLFALWSVYHRTYDFMLCLIPVTVLIDFVVNRRLMTFSYIWLAGFSLLALGLPGFVATQLSDGTSAPLEFFLLQSERLLVLGVFWSLIWVLWKRADQKASHTSLVLNEPSGKLA